MHPSNCARCGKSLAEWETFCTHCGAPRQAGSQPPYQPGPYPASPAQPGPRPKKQGLPAYAIISLVLASVIFLAGIGLLVWKFFLQPGEGGPAEGPTYLQTFPSRTPDSSKTRPSSRETEAPTLTPTTTTEAPADPWPGPDLLQLLYEMIPYEAGGILQRWEGPIRIQLIGNVTEADLECLEALIDETYRIGLLPPISLVEDEGNVLLYFVEKTLFKEIFEYGDDAYYEGSHVFYKRIDDQETGELIRFIGAINAWPDLGDLPAEDLQRARNYMTRLIFMRSLGVFGDSDQLTDSLLERSSKLTGLGSTDFKLLLLLYGPRIHSGMTMDEVIRILTPK